MKIRTMVWISFLALLFPAFVLASGPAGTIAHVEGAVEIIRSGKSLWAQPDMALLVRDGLKTGKASYAGIRFTDGSTLTMAPETEITVAEYSVMENSQKSVIEMAIGFMHCRVRKMGAGFFGLKKNRWEIHTDTAVVGVRGTDLWTQVTDAIEPTKEKPTECLVEDGKGSGHPAGLPEEVLEIPDGQSLKTTSAKKPASVGPPSDEMQKNVESLSGKYLSEPDAALFGGPSGEKASEKKEPESTQTEPDRAKGKTSDSPSRSAKKPPVVRIVVIGKQDFEACDKEIAKAKAAIAEWEEYISGIEQEGVWDAMIGLLSGSLDLMQQGQRTAKRADRSRDELERWKEHLRQLQAICRKMKEPKNSGGDGGNGH